MEPHEDRAPTDKSRILPAAGPSNTFIPIGKDSTTFFPKNCPEDLGLKKCTNDHYFHKTRAMCPECEAYPVREGEIDYEAAFNLEDDVFYSDERDGLDLEYFDLIKCELGHIRSTKKPVCKICKRLNEGGTSETYFESEPERPIISGGSSQGNSNNSNRTDDDDKGQKLKT